MNNTLKRIKIKFLVPYTRMLVYFTASLAAKNKLLPNYTLLVKTLKDLNHQIIADHIFEATEDKIRSLNRDDRLKFHDQVENWIQSCDFVLAETSHPSTSIGYEVALALRIGKPVLVLYSTGDAPSLLGQHKDEKLVAEKYNQTNVRQLIKDFTAFVEGKTDLRFTFFITPRIVNYLDKVSKHFKVPKSVYLRRLIEEDMKKQSL